MINFMSYIMKKVSYVVVIVISAIMIATGMAGMVVSWYHNAHDSNYQYSIGADIVW
jgi:hypothetical protein